MIEHGPPWPKVAPVVPDVEQERRVAEYLYPRVAASPTRVSVTGGRRSARDPSADVPANHRLQYASELQAGLDPGPGDNHDTGSSVRASATDPSPQAAGGWPTDPRHPVASGHFHGGKRAHGEPPRAPAATSGVGIHAGARSPDDEPRSETFSETGDRRVPTAENQSVRAYHMPLNSTQKETR